MENTEAIRKAGYAADPTQPASWQKMTATGINVVLHDETGQIRFAATRGNRCCEGVLRYNHGVLAPFSRSVEDLESWLNEILPIAMSLLSDRK